MIPYIIALLTLGIYWVLHARGDKEAGGLLDWIQKNPKTAAVQLGVMLVVVYFRAVLTPYLALPVVIGATTALLSGTFIDKLAKVWQWIMDQFRGGDGVPQDIRDRQDPRYRG